MRCIARGSLASPAKSGRDLYESLSLILGITCATAAAMEQETVFWESVRQRPNTDVHGLPRSISERSVCGVGGNRIRRLRNATDTQPDKLEPSRMKLDLAFWQSIKGSQTSGDYEAYLVQFHEWSIRQIGPGTRLPRRHWNSRRPLDSPVRPPRHLRAASKGTEGVALAPSIQDDNSQERKDTTNDRAIEAKILEQVHVFFHTVVWSQENWNSVGRKKAAAICIDWETSSPDEIAILDSGGRPDDRVGRDMERNESRSCNGGSRSSAWTFALRRNLPQVCRRVRK